MKIRYLYIKNFRGIKEAKIEFPKDKSMICLIGAGDSTKSTILTAINYALWPNWNLTVSTSDFYYGDTSESIVIEISFEEILSDLIKDSKYGLYLRSNVWDENDEPTEEEQLLTVRLTINDVFEPEWSVVCNRMDARKISTADRQKLSPGVVGIDFNQQINWGQGSVLSKYIDPKNAIKKNISIIEKKSKEFGEFDDLNEISTVVNKIAKAYGIEISDELNNRIALRSRNVSSVIELFEGDKPFNQRGYGSKKLLNLGLQIENEMLDALLLVDEVEIGLEPYRQRSLLHKIARAVTQGGQAIFTTHSPTVLAELSIDNLFVVHSKNGATTVCQASNENRELNSKLQGLLRSAPEAFLAPRVLICEGITEVGFVRSLDEWLMDTDELYMASKNVSYADGKGGNKTLDVAKKMFGLGYSCAVLIDNDRPEDEQYKEELIELGIPIFSWEKDKCIETAIIPLLQRDMIQSMLIEDLEKKNALWEALKKANLTKDDYELKENLTEEEIEQISLICAKKEFFKRVIGGELLGRTLFSVWANIEKESKTLLEIKKLIEWIKDES